MGRTFVTIEEAAELLSCTRRSVYNYIKRGQLRREVEAGSVVLSRIDVEQLAEDRGTKLPALNNKTLLTLMSRVTQLEMQVSVFRKMNGIHERPLLRPTVEEGKKLHDMARFFLSRPSFTSPELNLWSGTFSRFDEVTFDLLKRATGTDTFWKEFFDLCIHLLDFISDPKKSSGIREKTKLDLELSLGLKNLRSIILVWIELGHGKASTQLTKNLGVGKDDLVRRLTLS